MKDIPTLAVSIRLDPPAQRALHLLEASGLSRSEAIRKGLLVAADQLVSNETIRREAEMVAADPRDRQEMLETAEFMERLRAEG
jgi:hypothetical protein